MDARVRQDTLDSPIMICAARKRPAPAVTGPHAATDQYGRLDHYYFRCERCGLERTDPRLRHGCPECDGRRDDAPRA